MYDYLGQAQIDSAKSYDITATHFYKCIDLCNMIGLVTSNATIFVICFHLFIAPHVLKNFH